MAALILPIQQQLTSLDQRFATMISSLTTKVDDLSRSSAAQSNDLTGLATQLSEMDKALVDHKAIVDSEFVVMDSRIVAIPSHTSDAQVTKSSRATLSAFEKSAKKRLSDHDTDRSEHQTTPKLNPFRRETGVKYFILGSLFFRPSVKAQVWG